MQELKHVDASPAITNYELLSSLTSEMREAAEHGNWDQLISIEHQCSKLVAEMRILDAEATLNESELQQKDQLIRKILIDHEVIKKFTQAWMGELEQSMQSNHQELRLKQAYKE